MEIMSRFNSQILVVPGRLSPSIASKRSGWFFGSSLPYLKIKRFSKGISDFLVPLTFPLLTTHGEAGTGNCQNIPDPTNAPCRLMRLNFYI